MKIRNGFVSNSSSSSFMIDLTKVTPEQRKKILNIEKEIKKMLEAGECEDWGSFDPWMIWDSACNDNSICFYCGRDEEGYPFDEFMEAIGISKEAIT